MVQAKLKVGAVDDPFEREADRAADRVMRMPEPVSAVSVATSVAEGDALQRKCEGCDEKDKLHRKAEGARLAETGARPMVHEVLGSSGQPLDSETRAFMEPRFGHDFGHVRVHTDSRAADAAAAIGAEAFAVSSHIVFGAGRSALHTAAGRSLLAHELAHVIQQGGSRAAPERDTRARAPGAAGQHTANTHVHLLSRESASPVIQRREVCDENGACRSEEEKEANYTPAAALSAGPLHPPGDCTPGEHARLQAEVDRACDRDRRCTQNDDCATIEKRMDANAECIKARATINARCFRGGDPGHITALTYAINALDNCWAVRERKCRSKDEPVRVPVRKPVADKSFMDKMSALTGL